MMILSLPRVATGRGVVVAALAAVLVGSSLLESGCAKRRTRRAQRSSERAGAPRSQSIVLDGRPSEWRENVAAVADGDYLYFRLTLPDEVTLQGAPEPVTLMVDLDASAGTGMTLPSPIAAAGLGFDLGVQFSPQDGRGGIAAFHLDPTGAHVPMPTSQLGVRFAPTHSSNDFEIRISRHPDAQAAGALGAALGESGPASVMITLQDDQGKTVGWSDPETFNKPPAASDRPLSDADIPARPAGALRIVTWNVRRGAPMTNAGPYARVFQLLDADAYLVQEWDDVDAATLQAWFTAVVSGERTWTAHAGAGRGVAIIAPHPIRGIGPESIAAGESASADPVRWIAGVVQTPSGDLAVASVHLKCCGSMGSPEDLRRAAECAAINAAMREAFAQSGAGLRVIAGDVNLVGSRSPLDALRAGLDTDDSDLEPAAAFALGDRAMDTWADPTSQFTPGRLDYVIFGDAPAELVNAFVLDTTRLSEAALARLGLDRGDTDASDHRPVVIDLRPR
jgi:endonuclease/exonuclease/phosphatase family metal-dependent hydrolase